jgi:elongation factor Ts
MAEISATMVRDLRERTGAGMMDCKKALAANEGNFEAAVDWLRSKGLAAAAKKAGRTAAEGLVGVSVHGHRGAVVEVNSETDFVAKNTQFQAFVRATVEVALDIGADVAAIAAAPMPGGTGSVGEALTNNIATIGENQSLRRAAILEVGAGLIAPYIHNQVADGLGKIGVLIALESAAGVDVLAPLGRQLAMHVAAANPLALDGSGIDAELLERERAIAREKAAGSGKPPEIIEKMIEGGVRKFASENALMSQVFVIDGKTKIADVVAKAAKDAGEAIALTGFVRFHLGEGIDRGPGTDFAAEVAAAAGQG